MGNSKPDEESHAISEAIEPPIQTYKLWRQTIAEVSLRIRQAIALSEILQTTVDEIQQLLLCDRALIYRFDPDWNGNVVAEALSAPKWSIIDQAVHDTCFESSWLASYQEKRYFAVENVATADLTPCHAELLIHFQVQANLAVPILIEDRFWGLLIVHHCESSYAWEIETIEGLQQLAVQVSIAIHQAELVEQLETAKTHLEEQVSARTHELEVANQALEQANQALVRVNQALTQKVADRNRAKAVVDRREAFLRKVLDTLFTFVGVLTPEGILIEANQAPLTAAGLSREQVIGKPFADTDWWTPEASAAIRQAVETASQGQTVRFEIPVKVLGGKQIIVDFSLSPLRDGAGKITHLIPSGIDISDHKAATAASNLRREFSTLVAKISSRFINLKSSYLDGEIVRAIQEIGAFAKVDTSYIFKIDKATQTFSMTHEWCQSSFASQKALAQNIPLAAFPMSIATLQRQEVLYVPLVADLLSTAAHDHDSWQNFNIQAVLAVPLIQSEGVTGFMGFASFAEQMVWDEDIIQLLKVIAQTIADAQENICRQEQLWQLATIVESSNDAILSQTSQGIITSWNHAAERLFGHSAAEMVGQPTTQLVPSELKAEAANILARINQGEPVGTYETERLTQDNRRLNVSISIFPILNGDGQVIGSAKIVRDIGTRKQIEAALRQSEATNRALIRAIPDFLVRMSRDGIQQEVINTGNVHCLSPKDGLIEGHSVLDIMPTQVAQERIALAQQAISTGTSQKQEFSFIQDDQTYYEEARISPISESEVLVMVRDISDRKRSEIELRSTRDQLELVLQASSEGFWDWNLITNEIYFSPRWKAMLGYADHELENTLAMWQSVIFKEDRSTALQLVEDYNSGKIDRFAAIQRFHHKDGSTVSILSRAIHLKDAEGKAIRMVGSHLDMTQTRQMQDALQTSEMQLSGILNSSLDGIMAFRSIRDQQGQIIDFEWLLSNPTACELVHKSLKELLGNRLLEVMPGNRTDGLFDLYVEVVETGHPVQRQFHYSHDGIDTWFENIVVKLGDGFAVTFRDISALKISERALQQANQTLEANIQDLSQRNEEMLLLSETSDFLQACRSIEEACSVISTLVQPLFPGFSGSFYTTSASQNQLEVVAQWGKQPSSQDHFQPHDCWALRRGKWHHATPDYLGLRCSHITVDAPELSTLCIPMIAQGETLGLFHLSTTDSTLLNESKQQLARTVAEQVGLAIANLNLRETLQNQSIRDGLTGLFNRRYLEESLQKEIARAQRNQSSFAVVMLDIDHFKVFNDTHGHDAGDLVLQTIGQVLKNSTRNSDTVCRYGGEEMTLVFPETSQDEAIALAEKLRQNIHQLNVHFRGQQLKEISASFGVAFFPEHGDMVPALLRSADVALYRAKAAGRNQVVVALSELATDLEKE